MNKLIKEKHLEDKILIDSCGIGGWHVGAPPDYRARNILEKYDVECEGLLARKIRKQDGDDFDYIVGMDDDNIEDIKDVIDPNNYDKVYKLLSFTGSDKSVADPYYSGNFDRCFSDIYYGCDELLKKLIIKSNNEAKWIIDSNVFYEK